MFMKFGQVLAVRRDLLPAEYVSELEHLHDDVAPVPVADIRALIEEQLGGRLLDHFTVFDDSPLGSATIAQVHRGVLPDGRAVVVKVRRSGLAQRVAEDTAVLRDMAALADAYVPRLRPADPVALVTEFKRTLEREMDLRLEAHTMRRFRVALLDADGLWIPDVVMELSGPAVLVMEHSPGVRIDRYAQQHPERRAELARNVATLVLHQVFETGLFHADPHPGNLFVLPDGRLCLHDFGNIGELDAPMREGLTSLLDSVVRRDARDAADAYLDLGLVGGDVDRVALESDLAGLLTRLHQRSLAELSVGDALGSMLRVGTQHRVRNPGALLLLARAFLLAEAVMRDLDPTLDVVTVFRDQMARLTLQRYAPWRLAASARRSARDLERFFEQAPADLRRSLRRVADGELGRIRAPGVEEAGRKVSRDIERMTGSIVSAAFLVAGSLLVVAGGWHVPLGDALLFIGIAGSLIVAVGALRGRGRS